MEGIGKITLEVSPARKQEARENLGDELVLPHPPSPLR